MTSLIIAARQMNPGVAVAAKVEGAGSLPDPKIQWQVQNWPRDQRSILPRSPFLGDNMVTVIQMFPSVG